MTRQPPVDKTPKAKPVAAAAPTVAEDLSSEIMQTLAKARDEEIRCVRLYDDRYRCNWWVEDKSAGPVFMRSGAIRRSQFLRVKRNESGLSIEDLSNPAATVQPSNPKADKQEPSSGNG